MAVESLAIRSCTTRLTKWLEQSYSDSQTNKEHIEELLESMPYSVGEPTDDGSYRPFPYETPLQGVLYWSQMRHKYISNLQNKLLLEIFCYIENAPLLCILDGFLTPLDEYLNRLDESRSSDLQQNSIDDLFLEGLEYYCLLKTCLHSLRHQWKLTIDLAFSANSYKRFVESHQSLLRESLKQLVNRHSSLIHSIYTEATPKPIYIQFCDGLELNQKETEAMNYIFMRNSGVLFAKLYNSFSFNCSESGIVGGSRSNSMAMAAALFAEMKGYEMYEFFDEKRTHIKQEIFQPEDEFSTILSTGFLMMPPTIIKACYGCVLTPEESYKIDKTVMADIVNLKDSNGQPLPSVKDRKYEEEGEEGDMIQSLEDILRACDDTEHKNDSNEEVADNSELIPYKTDLEYLEDNLELIETLVKAYKMDTSDDNYLIRPDQRRPEAVLRELKAKARSCTAKINSKLDVTRAAGAWLPRLERLAELRHLNQFEKNVILTLTGSMVSTTLRGTSRSDSLLYHKVSIGFLISLFCEGLGEQIKARIYFYRNSRLVSEGLINVSDPPLLNRGNFLDNGVELDKRLLDYIVGLDTEINELVDGSDLYTPQVTLLDVALPSDQRQLLLSTLDSFKKFQETCKELKLSTHGYSKGLCLLFYGPSGTGKTMTANAIASHLGKKLLLVTVSILTEAQLTKDLLRFLFREAKIHNAIIFFDECEPLFETRDNRTNTSLALLLTEIEQYDGIIFLATNRHQDLDEAMHRRIQLALPFTVPDYTLRMEIWKTHIPDMLADKDNIDWSYLAQSYELTGGLIRNAILSAISLAAKEETNLSNKIVLTTQDLHRGAKLQLRGLLEMVDFERRIIPTYGLDELVLEDGTFKHIETLINAGKTHKFISTQWGFSSGTSAVNVAQATGIVCLLYGAAGVGKTSIANAVAYELGQPIKEAICTELLSHSVSSNPRSARGISSFFKDAQRANAIIVLDGAEFVLGIGSNSLASGLVGCEIYSLAYQIERYPGMVVLISRQNIGLLDLSRLPKLRFVIPVNWPNVKLREKLWKKLLPKKLPLADDIDAGSLAERFQFNGGEISCVICSAAETVATTNGRLVDNQLMIEAAENYLKINNLGKNENLLFQ